ncbi:hypothetical protein [Deinococcus marmoris]|uniref:Uncharacterized protein n=1 Tax=Deinococcus marmoris TaxID=249408 RepID=A0A1U7P4S0_9DEIO|nr:hypothetical protein [Deinococcus marmoris]OLV20175.1 hypothetical protein BOO71_0000553 [Deinococcus marmoris]
MSTLLAAVFLIVGAALVYAAVHARRSTPRPPMASTFRSVVVGALVFVVGLGILGVLPSGADRRTAAPAPWRAAPPARTDIQNLAIVAGVSENDPELTRQYARLQTLCPPANVSVADLVVNLQQMVRRESGRDMPLPDVMRQLATAQEGGAKAGMTCTETGGMLAELLIKGM